MSENLSQIARDWRSNAKPLASWVMRLLVNRTDVWGRYLPLKNRGDHGEKHAVTAPFRDERGKVFLGESSIEKHFRTIAPGGQLGLHRSEEPRLGKECRSLVAPYP